MLWKLILLFTVVPLAELFLLLWMASATQSPLFVFVLVLLTGVEGAALARWQGVGTWRRLNTDLAAGRVPTDALLDGLMIFLAGGLLLTPGILTDAVGFALLVPPLRAPLKRFLIARVKARTYAASRFAEDVAEQHARRGRDEVIESHLIDPDQDKDRGP